VKKHAAPIVAAILLLLSVLYVGSYLALVVPGSKPRSVNDFLARRGTPYRWGGKTSAKVFWPLEQIDRKVRPGAWEPGIVQPVYWDD
jgi:hypothetical protein